MFLIYWTKKKNFFDNNRNAFKNEDESDYKIDIENSKIFDQLKINTIEDENNFCESSDPEEDHKFPFNKNVKKNINEENPNKNDNCSKNIEDDIRIKDEPVDNKNIYKIIDSKNIFNGNNMNGSNDKTTNNFSKFNNLHNSKNFNSNANLKVKQNNNLLNNIKFNQTNFPNYNSDNSRPPTSFKVEDISNIMKRVLENNKKEAAAKSREFLNNYPQNYFNLAKTQTRFFIGSSQSNRTNKPDKDQSDTKNAFDVINFLEINLYDQPAWKRHEEVWEFFKGIKNEDKEKSEKEENNEFDNKTIINNIQKNKIVINLNKNVYNLNTNLNNTNCEKEKFLLPPSDEEILISAYYKTFNINGKIIIDDNIQNPKEEMTKWKNCYKKVVMRWHPDKLIPFIESLKIQDENRKNNIIKKAGVIFYHMNRSLKNIIEILKNITIKKEKIKSSNAWILMKRVNFFKFLIEISLYKYQ